MIALIIIPVVAVEICTLQKRERERIRGDRGREGGRKREIY